MRMVQQVANSTKVQHIVVRLLFHVLRYFDISQS
jgi:hypothetical protein